MKDPADEPRIDGVQQMCDACNHSFGRYFFNS